MTHSEWTEDLSVGVTEIDNQHKELFRRRNDLIDAIAAGRGHDELVRLTSFLETYIVTHFGLEEYYMTRFCYPRRDAHHQEHLDFMREFFEIKHTVQVVGPTNELVGRTGDFIIRWLRDHITIVDKEFGVFLREKLGNTAHAEGNVCIAEQTTARHYSGGNPDEKDLLTIEDGILLPGAHEVVLNVGQQTAWLEVGEQTTCRVSLSPGEGLFTVIRGDWSTVEPGPDKTVALGTGRFRVLAGGNNQQFKIIVNSS